MTTAEQIIIVGCGRLGSKLANELSADGHQTVVIDIHRSAFDRLSVDFSGYTVVGDATEVEVLKEAGIEKAKTLFATSSADNVNLMVAQVAYVIFGVPNVVARVYDPKREAVYREFGIETISPTNLSAKVFRQYAEQHDQDKI
jgi:trk system potassium uptake protein TrkA